MEAIADLLPFAAIVGIWLFRAMRSAKSKQRRPVPAATESSEPSAPTPFEQLMRQLEEALEEPKPEAETLDVPETVRSMEPTSERDRKPTSEPRTSSKPSRPAPRAIDAPTAFEAVFEHESHGFGMENPASEEAFEARPAFAPRLRAPAKEYDPHGLRSGRTAEKSASRLGGRQIEAAPRRGAASWAERLHDPAAAREALVLKTIFEGPWKPRSGKKER